MKLLDKLKENKLRNRIKAKIHSQESMLFEVQKEKAKQIRNASEYAKLWAIEKDYQRNIELLKSLL